ncbi:phosphoribosyltransferase [Candidatus Woesearchaeota archaeon]|nr:phosphoribosyltransferase [Candidatus Woesearchaeota archaeon]
MTRFEEIFQDIRRVFEKGDPGQQGMRLPGEKNEERKGPIKEVLLQGTKARGAGYRVRKRLKDQFRIVPVTSSEQEIPKYSDPTILFFDLKKLEGVPERFKQYVMENENTKLLVVDVDGREDSVSGFSFSVDTNHYLKGFERDIDPSISRIVAELYLNVDNAVDEEGIELGGEIIKPYFRTSALIEYDRSRVILEGILASIVMKFNPDVIASREVTGKPPEDDVRMYELAEPLAKRLGLEAVMIKEDGDKYSLQGDVEKKRVLLLKDVLGTGDTTQKIMDTLEEEKAHIAGSIVLLDRNEGASKRLGWNKYDIYSVTDLDMYQYVAAQKKIFDFIPVSRR